MKNRTAVEKIAKTGAAINGYFLYKLTESSTKEVQIFTDSDSPKYVGSIGKIGGEGDYVPFEYVENKIVVSAV